jgi:hypothetical protein
MHVRDEIRPGEHEQVVVAAEGGGVFAESIAAKILLAERVALEHRPHRPVEQQDAPRQLFVKPLHRCDFRSARRGAA